MVCLAHLAGAAAAVGDLAGMGTWSDAALAYARPRGWASSPQLLYAYVLAAAHAYSACDVALARRLSNAAEAILDGGPRHRLDGSTPWTVNASTSTRCWPARPRPCRPMWPSPRPPTTRPGRRLIGGTEAAIEQLYPARTGPDHRLRAGVSTTGSALLSGQYDLADVAVVVAARIPGMAGNTP